MGSDDHKMPRHPIEIEGAETAQSDTWVDTAPTTLDAPAENTNIGDADAESSLSSEVSTNSTPGSGAKYEALLQGLKWRRPDTVVERAESDGAPAAAHYTVHAPHLRDMTPAPMPSVLVSATESAPDRGAWTVWTSGRARWRGRWSWAIGAVILALGLWFVALRSGSQAHETPRRAPASAILAPRIDVPEVVARIPQSAPLPEPIEVQNQPIEPPSSAAPSSMHTAKKQHPFRSHPREPLAPPGSSSAASPALDSDFTPDYR